MRSHIHLAALSSSGKVDQWEQTTNSAALRKLWAAKLSSGRLPDPRFSVGSRSAWRHGELITAPVLENTTLAHDYVC